MKAWRVMLLVALTLPLLAADDKPVTVHIGAKAFTEGALLCELAAQLIERTGTEVVRHPELSTPVLWKALLAGEIDVYPEYTGTLMRELLQDRNITSVDELERVLADLGVRMSAPLGFSNSYALGMKTALAAELGITRISDLAQHPSLKCGFGSEFIARGDGWKSLRTLYDLPQTDVVGLEHALSYRGIDSGRLDVIDLYTTDAEIDHYELRALEDDRAHFPRYDAVWLYRADLAERCPEAITALAQLEGRIDERAMITMNRRAKIARVPDAEVAATFLADRLGLRTTISRRGLPERLAQRTVEHLQLVGISLSAAILLAIPCGILAARNARFGRVILSVVGVVQTIPSLVLLVFMIPLLGIGGPPAIAALFMYSLLPIVQNTYAGLTGIPPDLRESAAALGLPARTRLFTIELPTASRSIIAGIKTSAVINVGTATLGGLVGAGGYGQPIFTGIRLDDQWLMLEGAIPAALMALSLQWMFDLAERWLVPKGLRLKPAVG